MMAKETEVEEETPKRREEKDVPQVFMRIVDQPYVQQLIVDDGSNTVTVGTELTEVPPESRDAVHMAAFDAGILVFEGEEQEEEKEVFLL